MVPLRPSSLPPDTPLRLNQKNDVAARKGVKSLNRGGETTLVHTLAVRLGWIVAPSLQQSNLYKPLGSTYYLFAGLGVRQLLGSTGIPPSSPLSHPFPPLQSSFPTLRPSFESTPLPHHCNPAPHHYNPASQFPPLQLNFPPLQPSFPPLQ